MFHTDSSERYSIVAFSAPSPLKMFWDNLTSEIPSALLYILYEILPGTGYQKLRANRQEVRKVAKKLLEEKRNDFREQGGRDVMSLLSPSFWTSSTQ
jgi:cytochrome P450